MKERSLGEKMAAVEVYKENITTLIQQEGYIRRLIENHAIAKKTIESYAEAKEGDEFLVPVGGDAFLFAKVADSKRMLVGIGCDTIVETDFAMASARISSSMDEMGKALQNLSSRIVDMERNLSKLSAEIEAEYQSGGEPQEPTQG